MPTILFVDDEPNILKTLKRLFLDQDYDLHTANSGQEALDLIDTGIHPTVIVSDQRMPEMSGAEFLAKAKKKAPDSPVSTTNWSRGISMSIFFRLCSRAPRIIILSRDISVSQLEDTVGATLVVALRWAGSRSRPYGIILFIYRINRRMILAKNRCSCYVIAYNVGMGGYYLRHKEESSSPPFSPLIPITAYINMR